jgi:hypothetical protein
MVFIGVVMVGGGITIEIWQGGKADDVSDQIRIQLETELVEVQPRSRLLKGEYRKRFVARLKRSGFAGQKVQVTFCNFSFNKNFVDSEALTTAGLLEGALEKAGWRVLPWTHPRGCNGTGIWSQVSPKANPRTRAAANKIAETLQSLPMVANVTADLAPDEEPADPSTVVLTVESHPL